MNAVSQTSSIDADRLELRVATPGELRVARSRPDRAPPYLRFAAEWSRTLARTLSAPGFLIVAAGYSFHPGGSHWSLQKRICVESADFGMLVVLASLTLGCLAGCLAGASPTAATRPLRYAMRLNVVAALLFLNTPQV